MSATVQITRNGQSSTVTVREGQTLLEAMIEAQINPPFSCKAGICGTCKARLTSGQVRMEKHPALDQCDVDRGMILCCQSKATTAQIEIRYEN